jgi:hypothetical protein
MTSPGDELCIALRAHMNAEVTELVITTSVASQVIPRYYAQRLENGVSGSGERKWEMKWDTTKLFYLLPFPQYFPLTVILICKSSLKR